jgi:SAM-dependent methyltransferase
MLKMYNELAAWWPLISAPQDYVDEAAFFLPLLVVATSASGGQATLLELGSGGGNMASHLKDAFAEVVLVDESPAMLTISRRLNPNCEHIEGDMRTIRLDRTFDVVFIHDAIDYMTTPEALSQAVESAFVHCKPGGMAMFVPDHVRETFEETTDHGGRDEAERSVRYMSWSRDPDRNDQTYTTDYVFIFYEGSQPVQVEYEQHTCGLFSLELWLRTLRSAGFEAEYVVDPFERHVFIGRKPANTEQS